MALAAKIYVAPDEQRDDERASVRIDATVRVGATPIDAVVEVLSATGCLLSCATPLAVGADLSIGMAGPGVVPARVVRSGTNGYGCAFSPPLTNEQVAASRHTVVVPFPGNLAVGVPSTTPSPTSWSPRGTLFGIIGFGALSWAVVAGTVLLLF